MSALTAAFAAAFMASVASFVLNAPHLGSALMSIAVVLVIAKAIKEIA
jgi:hypothetical protein